MSNRVAVTADAVRQPSEDQPSTSGESVQTVKDAYATPTVRHLGDVAAFTHGDGGPDSDIGASHPA